MGDSFHNLRIDGGKFIKDLKVVELKIALEKRGLSKLGNKKELTQRLSIVSKIYLELFLICIFLHLYPIIFFLFYYLTIYLD